jgi:penicillin-binding protein 2
VKTAVLTRKGQSGAPVGTPRRAADMPLPGQERLSPAAAPTAPAALPPRAPNAQATAQLNGRVTAP